MSLKKSTFSAIITIVLILNVRIVSASAYGNDTAFCVGTNYGLGDINTTNDATSAALYYDDAGLYSITSTAPTKAIFNSTNSHNYKKLLNSGIVFLSGHGSSSTMGFNYNGSGGNYNVGVSSGNANYTGTNGRYYYGLGQFDLDDVALYVFAGCETAAGSSNISKWVVNNGAKISLGWTTEVSSTSHPNWLNRFNSKLSETDGYFFTNTVASACTYADSFIYLNNNVKNHAYYGSSNLNPLSIAQTLIISTAQTIKRDPVFVVERILPEAVPSKIKDFLHGRFGDRSGNFIIEENGFETLCYDCIFTYKSMRTNVGITCIYDPQKATISVYDNMLGCDIENIIEHMDSSTDNVNSDVIEMQIRSDRETIVTEINGKIDSINQFVYYDVIGDEIYTVLSYVANDQEGCKFADDILNKISL